MVRAEVAAFPEPRARVEEGGVVRAEVAAEPAEEAEGARARDAEEEAENPFCQSQAC